MDLEPQDKPAAVDLHPSRRPGVPRELRPHRAKGVHWDEPERQEPNGRVLKHRGRKELPPVFGTAQPPTGLSGLLRRLAYRIPEEKARHWLTLLLADRVDVLESRLAGTGGVVALLGVSVALVIALRPRG
jgi:hypothetical protein